MDSKAAMQGVIETQLSAWAVEVDRLKAKVDRQIAEAKEEYYDRVEELGEEIHAQLKKWRKEIESAEAPPSAQQMVRELRNIVEADLDALAPEIDALRTAASDAEAQAKHLISELKARRKALKEKLAELKEEGLGDDVETDATKAWAEFRPALQSAISKFK